jgi:hypothetical protein
MMLWIKGAEETEIKGAAVVLGIKGAPMEMGI